MAETVDVLVANAHVQGGKQADLIIVDVSPALPWPGSYERRVGDSTTKIGPCGDQRSL